MFDRAAAIAARRPRHAGGVKLGPRILLRQWARRRASHRRASACRSSSISSFTTSPTPSAKAVEALAPLEPAILTVHAAGGRAMMAAAKAAAPPGTKVVGVTVLTSLDATDLASDRRRRFAGGPGQAPRRRSRAKPASTASSARARKSRRARDAWPEGFFVVPGVRPEGGDVARPEARRHAAPMRSTTAPRCWSSAGRSPAPPIPRRRSRDIAASLEEGGHRNELAEPGPQRHPVPAQAPERRESVAQVRASAGRWCSSRSGRRITASARAATSTTASARPSASSNCSTPPNIEILPAPEVREDPLRFKDTKRYTDRLKAARAANGERDALVNARGKIDGHKVDPRRAGFRLHGRIDGHRRRRGVRRRGPRRDRRQGALHHLHRRRAARACRKAIL